MDLEKIWLKNYQPGVPHEIDPDSISSLVALIENSCQKFGNAPAFSNFGHVLTYNEVDEATKAFAAFLQSQLHMVKGERVAVMLPNCLQYPIAIFGALRAGCTVVNVNPMYTATELEHQLVDCGATCVIVMENFAHVLEQALPKIPNVKHVITTQLGDLLGFWKGHLLNSVVRYVKKMIPRWDIPGSYSMKDVLEQGRGLPFHHTQVVGDDIAFLQYTGGTTGVSKGAVLTHRNIVANLLQADAWIKPVGHWAGLGGIVTALPLYHIFSLTANCLTFFQLGVENILITNPRDLKSMIRELKRRPFCAMTGVNTLFNALLNEPEFAKLNFKDFKVTLGGGMAVQKAVALRWKAVTGVPLLEAYGLTETSPAVTINPLSQQEYSGSIGLPVPSTDVMLVDENHHPVSIGQPGELCVKGPQVMQGYWQRAEETAAVLKDGWLYTGDIAILSKDGFLRIVDRKKDMIIISGFKVYPNEIEDVIASYDGVKEVAVIGLPTEMGEMVKAYIVLKNDKITKEMLFAHCRQYLTGYKMPKEIEFRAELPKTNVGKVLRRALRDEALIRQAAAGQMVV